MDNIDHFNMELATILKNGDIVTRLFGGLPVRCVCICSQISKKINELLKTNQLWISYLKNKFLPLLMNVWYLNFYELQYSECYNVYKLCVSKGSKLVDGDLNYLGRKEFGLLLNKESPIHIFDVRGKVAYFGELDFMMLSGLVKLIIYHSPTIFYYTNNSSVRFTFIQEIDFSKMTKLNHLELVACGLKSLPIGVCGLLELKKIDFSSNMISSLPIDFINLQNLEDANFSSNLISDLPFNVIDDMPKLVEFNVSKNPITIQNTV